MITPWLQATAKRRSGATRRHLHMSIAVGLLAGVAGRMVVPCGIPSVLDRQWFHAEWGTLMVHLGLVPDSPGSENPTASFSSGSAVPLSYIIYLPDWTLICRSVLAHPPTDREEKKFLQCACVLEAKPRRRDFPLILHRDFSSGLVPCIFRKGTD